MAISESQKRSVKKSQDKNCIRFNLIMLKSKGTAIKQYIHQIGETNNKFFVDAAIEKIERDTGKSFDEFLKEQQQEQEPEEPAEPKDTK